MTISASPSQCPHCGAALAADGTFCESCGRRVDKETRPAPAYAPADQVNTHVHYGPAAEPATGATLRRAFVMSDPLVGSPTPNQTYLGNRLTYTDATTEFDPVANQNFRQAVQTQFWGVLIAWILGGTALFLIFGIIGIFQQLSSVASIFGGESSTSPAFAIWLILSNLWTIAALLYFLLKRLPVQLTEWMLTIDGKAAAARATLDHMAAIFTARRTPVRSVRAIEYASARQEPRTYLQVEEDIFTGFVSSFAFGSDLYVGWTFCINMSPGRWLTMMLFRRSFYSGLFYEQPKALREVLHSVVRQGVDMATGQVDPVGQGIVGSSLPVNRVRS